MILIKSIAEVRTMLILFRARAELLVVMAAVQRRLSTTCGGERERERDESPVCGSPTNPTTSSPNISKIFIT